ncbi:MAG TPA: hypothetical protein VHK70_08425 [Burkholderiaceae bacterium]|jgi:hypothetical protein|nr:hypothetical protein [Burkholderiaceae bacterium]
MRYDNSERSITADTAMAVIPEHRSVSDVSVVKTDDDAIGPSSTDAAKAGKIAAAQVKRGMGAKEIKLHELTILSLMPIFRRIRRWWLTRAERHYLICADVEEQRAREAQMNVAYYQKRAALARSARHY